MSTWVLRRAGWTLLVVWVVVSLTFVLAQVVPADPARTIAGPRASAEVVERVRTRLGIGRPLHEQYVRYLGRLARGDLGESYRTRRPVRTLIGEALPRTLLLALLAIAVQAALGLSLGLYAALRKGRAGDVAALGFAQLGVSAPPYLIGLVLLYVVGFRWHLLPIGGSGDTLASALLHAVLPALTLGLGGAAVTSRVLRAEYLEVDGADYMRTARAKGLPGRTVVVRHGLRNALLPVITLLGIDLGALAGGAVVSESVFSWPGVGKLAVDAVSQQDIPLLLGTVLVGSVAVAVANLFVDLAYAWLDPRIRLTGRPPSA